MTNYCSCMLSLLFLILITHWTNAASLHFSLYSVENNPNFSSVNNEFYRSEYMNSQLPLLKRLKRWSRHGDNDEVEISLNNSDDSLPFSSTMNSTIESLETTELNLLVTEYSNNTTSLFLDNITTIDIQSDDNTTIRYPLLRQDLSELNQTNDQITNANIEELFPNHNHTSFAITNAEILVTNMNEVTTNNKTESNELESTSIAMIPTQISVQNESITFGTVFSNVTIDYPTISSNNTTFSIESVDEYSNNTNLSQKDAIISIDPDISLNDSEINAFDTFQNSNESSNSSSKAIAIPICDLSCQCLKECLYGFEILNDTCLCTPPCDNYPCFGNDICVITEEGHPYCQPQNGTEHDRPTRCYQPRDAGFHDIDARYHNRWYYHPDQDTCHLFVYRGLGGNENNFLTLHECHLECITCAPSPDRGECLGRMDMWYYDNKSKECRQFEYSGCKGNENQFMKKEQCIDTCINRTGNFQ
ncbi:hypothetical protein I4U23_018538 [Adineta vaga]|nr:hypothetical protein I4U23_018538 [Adineta vaga]